MRRKLSPRPIAPHSAGALPLVAALARATLPTAAALAIALSGCSGSEPEQAISADTVKQISVPAATKSGPVASSSAIDPTPMALPGVAAMVVPAPASTITRPTPTPSPSHPKLGGKSMMAHPSI